VPVVQRRTLTKSEAEVSEAPIVEQFAIGSFGPID
jgi:hypothetical protein